MIAPKRPLFVFLLTNAVALSVVLALVFSCKKTDDTATPAASSIQGNWRLTSINISPAYVFSGIPLTELVMPLNALEGNCVANLTLAFNANNTVTNNVASVSACTNAPLSKQLLDTFFGTSTTYSESASQVILKGAQTVTATKAINNNSATLIAQLPNNPGNQPTPTSYTLVMARQ